MEKHGKCARGTQWGGELKQQEYSVAPCEKEIHRSESATENASHTLTSHDTTHASKLQRFK